MPVEALSKELPKLEAKLSMLYEDKLEGIIDNTFFLKKKNEYNYTCSLIAFNSWFKYSVGGIRTHQKTL